MLHLLDVIAPPHVDEYCCSAPCFAGPHRSPSVSRCFHNFLFLCSPYLVDRDKVPVFVFELAKLLDELADPVGARQGACVFLDHLDCDHVIVVVFVSYLQLFRICLDDDFASL